MKGRGDRRTKEALFLITVRLKKTHEIFSLLPCLSLAFTFCIVCNIRDASWKEAAGLYLLTQEKSSANLKGITVEESCKGSADIYFLICLHEDCRKKSKFLTSVLMQRDSISCGIILSALPLTPTCSAWIFVRGGAA